MKIIIVDGVESERLRLELLLSGQNGYNVVLSARDAEEALSYMSRNSADPVVIDLDLPGLSGVPAIKAIKNLKVSPLTRREGEILELLRQGNTLESIADSLCLSFHTIHTHTRNIYSKLNVNSRSQAVYKFFQMSVNDYH